MSSSDNHLQSDATSNRSPLDSNDSNLGITLVVSSKECERSQGPTPEGLQPAMEQGIETARENADRLGLATAVAVAMDAPVNLALANPVSPGAKLRKEDEPIMRKEIEAGETLGKGLVKEAKALAGEAKALATKAVNSIRRKSSKDMEDMGHGPAEIVDDKGEKKEEDSGVQDSVDENGDVTVEDAKVAVTDVSNKGDET